MKTSKIIEKEKEISEMQGHIVSDMHDLWVTHEDAQKIVLFLDEMKIYWQIRATAEMLKEDGALGSFLIDGIKTGISEQL